MNLKLSWSIFLCSLLFLCSFSSEEHGKKLESSSSLLWKIEGTGVHKDCYLFGTMHMIQKDRFYFPTALQKKIRKSQLVISEVDLDDLDDQMKLMPYLTLQEGNVLDFFTEKQQDTLLNWAKEEFFLDKEAFLASMGKMKPFVLLQLTTQMSMVGKVESYEMSIAKICKEEKIETLGLEGLEEQIGFLDALSKEQQAEMVIEAIRDGDKAVEMLRDLQDMYLRQEMDSLYLIAKNEGGTMGSLEQVFLAQRNHNWIPKIKAWIAEKSCFIAVGAGHLGGEEGVINLLRKEGYRLTPVKI
ncbi:MAG: TraB/GumN family protein [Bacteroidetes bacterium]|nr:MAG: TraB/GumN family protein [Bacteroidota bacterium]